MPPPPEIIDLVSDSEDEAPPPVAPARGRQIPDYHRGNFAIIEPDNDILADYFPDLEPPLNDPALPAMGDLVDVPLFIDDFDYLEEDPQMDQEATTDPDEGDVEQPLIPDAEPGLSQEDCLSRVYDLFPDICPEHAKKICTKAGQNSLLSAAALLDQVVEKLLADNTYPKRKKEAQNLKRKREESVDYGFERWERENREALPNNTAVPIRAILKADFPAFTHVSIGKVVAEEKYLFKSYIRLANLRDTDGVVRRGRPSTVQSDADTIAANWPELGEELVAARRRAQANKNRRLLEMAERLAEDKNLKHAIATGDTAECQACFDDLPTNRQIHCHGEVPHFTCFSCIKTYIASEIGDARCRVLCTAGCGAGFEPVQLNRIDDKRLLEKLADLQQEQDIRDAGLEDLEECPFCDYKAIMPPVEENFEFRCANPECEKVSCRRCKSLTHIPISCEQHAKNKKACSRHTIEEAMTAALLRSCNNCKKQFIKEYGCNKMTCPSCKNLQCYVCSETLKGYDHFDQHPGGGARAGGKCPLYDNLEERHEREVQAAKETATALVIANNPDVEREDLEIKVSDAVKKSTERQIRQAGPEGLGGGPANARWGAGMFLGGLAANIPHFNDDDDDDNFDAEGADPFAAHVQAHAQAMLRQNIARQRREVLPVLAHDVVPAGLQARLRRQQGQRQQEEDEMRPIENAMPAGPELVPRQLDAVQRINQLEDARQQRIRQLEDARQAVHRPPPRLNPQQHDQNLANERLNNRQPWLPDQQPPLFAPGGLDALYRDFEREQFPHALRHLRPLPPQPMAQPPTPALAPYNDPDVFREPIDADRGLELARVRARHHQAVAEGLRVARADPIPNLPAPYVPRDPNAQLNAAGLANVQRNLHHLELMRQQHDERTGNVPIAPPGVQLPPPGRRGPQYFGWQ
jgi:TRIAD3 protein (E3 ubiquitin-protein ligase RNF216)